MALTARLGASLPVSDDADKHIDFGQRPARVLRLIGHHVQLALSYLVLIINTGLAFRWRGIAEEKSAY